MGRGTPQWVLFGVNRILLALIGSAGCPVDFHWVSLDFDSVFLGLIDLVLTSSKIFLDLLGFIGFYWVLLGFNGFYWIFVGFYWVSLVKLDFIGPFLGLTGFYWVFLKLY